MFFPKSDVFIHLRLGHGKLKVHTACSIRCTNRPHAENFQYTPKIPIFSPAALYYVIFQYTLQEFQYTPKYIFFACGALLCYNISVYPAEISVYPSNLRTKRQYTHGIHDKKTMYPRIIGINFSIPSNHQPKFQFTIVSSEFQFFEHNGSSSTSQTRDGLLVTR